MSKNFAPTDVSVLVKTNLGKLLCTVKRTRQMSDKQNSRHTRTSICERSELGMCRLWLRQSGFGNTIVLGLAIEVFL